MTRQGWKNKGPFQTHWLGKSALPREVIRLPYSFLHLFTLKLISYIYIYIYMVSLMAQMIKNLCEMQETRIWSLGQEEDPLEKGMATHSSIPSWRIASTEEPGRLGSPWGCKELDMTEWLTLSRMKLKVKWEC